MISYSFSSRFLTLDFMMWAHFSFYISFKYEFKKFEHYFNVFWWTKQPFEKNARESQESTSVVITKQFRKNKKLILLYRWWNAVASCILLALQLKWKIQISRSELGVDSFEIWKCTGNNCRFLPTKRMKKLKIFSKPAKPRRERKITKGLFV